MKKMFIALGLAAFATMPIAAPALAQTVIVTPPEEPPPPPPPVEPSTVIVTPPPEPTVECRETKSTEDKIIGSETKTTTDCVRTP
ncbi:hypothetical protein [Terrihabitans sp. B22-R8]|uniref:hypothetical protein n=1 Tax=Terrihabitans sp. B22-R8 TaxID=3425128 RepID=UPI00403D07FF